MSVTFRGKFRPQGSIRIQKYVSPTEQVPLPVANPAAMTVAFNSINNPVPLDLMGGGEATSVKVTTGALHGLVSINGLTMTYRPTLGYSGSDSFAYAATNSGGDSTPATISITVLPQVPTANLTKITIEYNSTSNVVVPSLNGGVATNLAVVAEPTYGTVVVDGLTFLYTPPNDYQGPDTFTFTASNAGGVSDVASVEITVNAPPPPPRPRWLTESDLGIYDKNTELYIPLEHTDPSANITGFELVDGVLPANVLLNPFDGSLSGTPTDTVTTTYNFSVAINTSDGLEPVIGDFSLTINADLTRVVWQTEPDLGTVDGGSGFSASLQAKSVKNNVH